MDWLKDNSDKDLEMRLQSERLESLEKQVVSNSELYNKLKRLQQTVAGQVAWIDEQKEQTAAWQASGIDNDTLGRDVELSCRTLNRLRDHLLEAELSLSNLQDKMDSRNRASLISWAQSAAGAIFRYVRDPGLMIFVYSLALSAFSSGITYFLMMR